MVFFFAIFSDSPSMGEGVNSLAETVTIALRGGLAAIVVGALLAIIGAITERRQKGPAR
jgi:hypothetical protein